MSLIWDSRDSAVDDINEGRLTFSRSYWTSEDAPLRHVQVYRDHLDRVQIGTPPAVEPTDAHPLVWVGHNQ